MLTITFYNMQEKKDETGTTRSIFDDSLFSGEPYAPSPMKPDAVAKQDVADVGANAPKAAEATKMTPSEIRADKKSLCNDVRECIAEGSRASYDRKIAACKKLLEHQLLKDNDEVKSLNLTEQMDRLINAFATIRRMEKEILLAGAAEWPALKERVLEALKGF